MIEQARENAGHGRGRACEFEVAGFGELGPRFPGPFDALTCLGNSLPHLLDDAIPCRLPGGLRGAPAAGQVCSSSRTGTTIGSCGSGSASCPLPPGRTTRGRRSSCESPIFARQPTRAEESIDFTIVTLRKREGAWTQAVQIHASACPAPRDRCRRR